MIRWINTRRESKRSVSSPTSESKRSVSSPTTTTPTRPDTTNWTLLVLDLTVKSRPFVSNLDRAIASVNVQVQRDFQPEWKVTGKLINKTADFHMHLTLRQRWGITGPNSDAIGAQLVDWIVHNEEGIDWSKTGIVYVTDPQMSFGGVHLDKEVQSLDIPFALVGARDENWSVVLSHEVLELLADPWGSRFVHYHSTRPITYVEKKTGERKTALIAEQDWIVEVCDAIEADADGYQIQGIPVSNFIAQAYYDTNVTSHLDYRNLLKRGSDPAWPFPINEGGYLSFMDAKHDFYQITWFEGSQPIYTKITSSGGAKELLSNPHKSQCHPDHQNHRLLKYWRSHSGETETRSSKL